MLATPLTYRRLQDGQNVRALILGDSIVPILLRWGGGALRRAQGFLGHAGGGGLCIESAYIQRTGSAVEVWPTETSAASWFHMYVSVPSGSAVEFSGGGFLRVPGTHLPGPKHNFAKVLYRAPVGGTATFKFQACSDADGETSGTWVELATITATASSGTEEIGSFSTSLSAADYRLRVLATSGTVDVFGFELSTVGSGVAVFNYGLDGNALSAFASMSDAKRSQFIQQVNPDVVFVCYKDDLSIIGALEKLKATLDANRAGSFPRDLVLIAPYPTASTANGWFNQVKEQRDAMEAWARNKRCGFIDLWTEAPLDPVFYDGSGIHAASGYEIAFFGQEIMERLGWRNYS